MRKLIYFLVLISIVFVSCDSRKNQNDLLQEAISEYNKNQPKVETISFYPIEYTEVTTDTLISNKVKVHIKNYSLEDETILLTKTDNHTKYHRVFESEISIKKNNKNILTTKISAKDFATTNDIFWDNATLEQVWVNQEISTVEEINLEMSFVNPLDKTFKLYRMSVNQNGKQQTYLIEEQS
ncbi:hypothetical protein [Formosa maritima]|uniref:DUF4738 domain-containing protein n=1 Tax=Formosa maritima TaxID=2592046 RepID=A0A5D0GIM1_9FLAO|nr:hypothetical protein [Formosa maritima]TYA58865.1 hypothetical protein FVF61_01555 [Formosa maritima]